MIIGVNFVKIVKLRSDSMKIYSKALELIDRKRNILKDEVKVCIGECNKVLYKYIDHSLLNTWSNNIRKIKVANKNPFTTEKALYDLSFNIIYLSDVNDKATIFHELLHAATTIVKKNSIHSGFAFYSDTTSLGVGINEGYTEFLVERLFGYKNKNEYNIQKEVVKLVEDIIGRKKMMRFYFSSSLELLIKELQKYISLSDITCLITLIDKIYNSDYKKIKRDDIVELERLIVTIYSSKYKTMLLNKEIDEDAYFRYISRYLDRLEDFDDEVKYYMEYQKISNLIN